MKFDQHGVVIMELDGYPGDIGDSCAETGRLCVIDVRGQHECVLDPFITPTGFVRHPDAPEGWREDDFSSDQMLPLLMGSFLRCSSTFEHARTHLHQMPQIPSIGVRLVASKRFQLFAVAELVQILINLLPIRWSDAHNRKGFWNFWRFEWSHGSTVSFMSVTTAMIFLKRIGITWPLRFFPRKKYLEKTRAYYANQPNSEWFVELFEKALT